MKKALLFLALFSFNLTAQIPTNGLVAYYPSNGNANDGSGNGLNGTNNGAVLATDRFNAANKAFSFNGTSSYIAVPHNNSLNFGQNSFSISAWINPASQKWQEIVGKYYETPAYDQRWALQLKDDGKVQFHFANTSITDQHLISNSTYSLNKWMFVTVVMDRANTIAKLYINGILDNTQTSNISGVFDNNEQMTIGKDNVANAFFNGKIDDIRIYNRALSQVEIFSLFTENYSYGRWDAQNSGSADKIYDVYFTNSTTGFASTLTGKILKTSDGGLHWTAKNTGYTEEITAIHFVDENNGFAVSYSRGLFKTTDAGESWIRNVMSTNSLMDIVFVNSQTGWIAGNGPVLKTTDGGATWIQLSHQLGEALSAMDFLDQNYGAAVGNNGSVMTTTNGGSTWVVRNTGLINGLYAVKLIDQNIIIAAGYDGKIIRSTNGGDSWISINSGTTQQFLAIECFSKNLIWLSGAAGIIKKSTDYGITWINDSSFTTAQLWGMHFSAYGIGYAVGTEGQIFRYTGTVIDAPFINLTSPNGGENKLVGAQDTIKWTSIGVTNVKIELTTNNGTNWNTVVASTPASTGNFVWTVPNTPSSECKIKISDASNAAIADTSNATFKIQTQLQYGLVAYYPFNGNANDESGNGRHGTVFGGAAMVADRFGNINSAYRFDGINDYIKIDNGPSLANQSFSVSFWVKREPPNFIFDCILGQGAMSSNNNLHIGFRDNGIQNNFTFDFFNNGLNVPDNYTDTLLHHWACTYNLSSNERKIYRDGMLVGSDIASSAYTGSGALYIGMQHPDQPGYFYGLLDDIRLYNRPLSKSEIDSLYYGQGYNSIVYGGKTYHTVTIGTQTWLKENLDIGNMIQGSQNASNNSIIEKYCYDNNPTNCNTYGGLYQWYEAMAYTTAAGTRGICPEGWHMPSSAEFQTLNNSVDGSSNALKAIGKGTGSGAGNNTSGFSALLEGYRTTVQSPVFDELGVNSHFWSSNMIDESNSQSLFLLGSSNSIEYHNNLKIHGFPVRCIKDGSASINLTSPNGGENKLVGAQDTIKWTSTGVTNVKIELTTNNGTNWSTIVASTPASKGSYVWTVPNSPSNICKMRIADASNSALNDTSESTFSIQANFSELASIIPGHWSGSIVAGDYNNDGKYDLLISGGTASGRRTSIYKNTGSGGYSLVSQSTIENVAFSDAEWVDVNNDNLLDIALVGGNVSSNGMFKIYLNNGNETFTELLTGITGTEEASIEWADYNNDGFLDFIYSGQSIYGNKFMLYKHIQGTSFIEQTLPDAVGIRSGDVKFVDFNKDSFIDIISTGIVVGSTSVTQLYKNEGGFYTKVPTPNIPGFANGKISILDFNSDALPDILISGTASGYKTYLYKNLDNFVFEQVFENQIDNIGYGSSAAGDYNNDGYSDIIISGQNLEGQNVVKLYKNVLGTGFTIDTSTVFPGVINGSVRFVDCDNDRDLDIVYTGDANPAGFTKIFQNNYPTLNQPPATPDSLVSSVESGNIVFTWKKSWDDTTPVNALTYNIRIGSNSGGNNIVCSNSDSNGFYKLQKSGNVGQNTMWIIKNMWPGTYYWSVQSIDNSFASSQFAPERSFTVGASISLLFPNGGENKLTGAQDTIKWTSTGVTNIKIELTTNNGTNWSTVAASTPASTGYYVWTVPNTPSYLCKIKITNSADSLIADTSNGVFTIYKAPEPCEGIPTVAYGGRTYNTVKIGDQCWLKENINIGTMITATLAQTNNQVIEKYCYANDTNFCATYGGFYQWNEAMQYAVSSGAKGICPTGWHIPTEAQLQSLLSAAGNNSNNLKAVGQGNGGGAGNNTTGFSALMTGYRDLSGNLGGAGFNTYFWTSTEYNAQGGTSLFLYGGNGDMGFYGSDKSYGYTVRCIKDVPPPVAIQVISPNGGENKRIGAQDTIKWTSTGAVNVKIELSTDNGTNWNTVTASTTASSGTYIWTIPNSPSLLSKIRISDEANSSYSDVSDSVFYIVPANAIIYGGKIYNTVQIGTQTWLKENLDIGQFAVSILTYSDHSDVTNNGIIEKYCYENNVVNCATYGGLYDWSEAMQYVTTQGTQGICPTGWHIPTNAEFQTLANFVGGNSNALKALGQGTGSGTGTNTSGFSALLAGCRSADGNFYNMNLEADFWTSTENGPQTAAGVLLYTSHSIINPPPNGNRFYGFSIRCINNSTQIAQLRILTPDGGENKLVGAQDTIKWTSTGVTNVKIELTTNNGTNWSTVVASTPANTEKYIWTIPNSISPNCRIRISDASNSAIMDSSDGTFRIVLKNGLVAYFPFNGTTNDSSGYGNNLINTNAAPSPDRFGAAGKSYYFDGSQSRMYKDAGAELSLGNNFTLSTWINVAGNGTDSPRLIAVGPLGTSANHYALYVDMNSRRIGFYVPSPGDPVWTNYISNTSHGWKLVTATVEGSNVRIYIDNKLDKSATIAHNFPAFSNARLQVGYSENSSPTDLFNGKLDDICIYNRALTLNEIDSIYYSGGFNAPPAPPTNLTGISLDKQVRLTWNKSKDSDIRKYRIYRSLNTPATILYDSTAGPNDTTKLFTGLKNGQKYYYAVKAVDSSWQMSDYSNEISVAPTGMIAWYPFNNNANDTTNNWTPGTLNSISYTADRFGTNGRAAYVNGNENSYINIGKIELLNQFTLAGWVKLDPASGSPGSAFFSNSNQTSGYEVLHTGNTGGNKWKMTTGASSNLTDTAQLQPNRWYHITATFDGLNTGRIYVNGQLSSLSNTMTPVSPNSTNTILGKSAYNSNFLLGAIDDIRLYNRQLNSNEVDSLYRERGWTGNDLNLIRPNGGEVIIAGTAYNITWTAVGITSLKIDFTPDNGVNWNNIAANVNAASGGYSWSVPDLNSNQCRIRLTDMNNLLISDSSSSVFTLQKLPGVIVLSKPDSAAIGLAADVTFRWRKDSESANYELIAANDPLFQSKVIAFSDTMISDTFRSVQGVFNPNTTYFWKVRGKNIAGKGGYSNIWQFRTKGTATLVQLVQPVPNAVNVPVPVQFIWRKAGDIVSERPMRRGDESAGKEAVNKYWFELTRDTLSPFISRDTLLTENDTAKVVDTLQNNSIYFWRVKARNEVGWGQFGYWSKFTTIYPYPGAVSLLQPANDTLNQPLAVTMKWRSAPFSESYRLQLFVNDTLGMPVADSIMVDTTFTKSGLQFNTVYYWRVSGKNIRGQGIWSARKFTTRLPVVVLAAPAPDSTVNTQTPRLSWFSLPNVANYHIQVSSDTSFSSPFVDDQNRVDSFFVMPALPYGQSYYWRVRGRNGANFGDYSLRRRFTVYYPPAIAPVLIAPDSGAINLPQQNVLLRWNFVSGASGYQVQVSKDTLFTAGMIAYNDSSLTSNQKNLPSLGTAQKYYWRVRGKNQGGWGAYSRIWNFSTTVPSPVDLSAVSSNKKVRISWTMFPDSNIVSYNISRRDNQSGYQIIGNTTNTAYKDTPLVNGKTYYYRIQAISAGGAASAYSDSIQGSPYNRPPLAVIPEPDVYVPNAGAQLMYEGSYSSFGSRDQDENEGGAIVARKWYVDGKYYPPDTTLIHYTVKQGTHFVKLVVIDNDGAKDSVTRRINVTAFKKYLGGQIFAGLSKYSSRIYVFVKGGSNNGFWALDSLGNVNQAYSGQIVGEVLSSSSIDTLGNIYLGSTEFKLYGFRNNLTQLWPELNLGSRLSATPTIDDEDINQRMYIGVEFNRFQAINRMTGRQVWSMVTDGPVVTSSVIDTSRTVLFFTTAKGVVYGMLNYRSVDTLNPAPKWMFNLSDSISTSPAIDKDGYYYVGSRRGRLYKLQLIKDAAGTVNKVWDISLNAGGAPTPLTASPVIDNTGNVYIGSRNGKFFKVSNGGQVLWSVQTLGPVNTTAAISYSNRIYAANEAGEVFAFASNGDTLMYYKDSAAVCNSILADYGMIYFANANGRVIALFDSTDEGAKMAGRPQWGTYQSDNRRSGGDRTILGGVDDASENFTGIPSDYQLMQNYPNPFNPVTTIEYALPEESLVRIKIYNVTGEVIDELVNAFEGAGYHRTVWATSHLSTGVYFYSLEAVASSGTKTFKSIKKMVYLK